MRTLLHDLRYAARALRRAPGFTLVAVLTFALGIGAATAMFSVLNGVLLRELPVGDQDDLVVLWTEAPAGAYDHLPLMQGDLEELRENTRTLDGVAGVAFQGAAESVLLDGSRPLNAAGTWVTGDYFSVLDLRPVHGRTLLPTDDVPGAEPVMVIGYDIWQRYFGGDPAAVGRRLEWNGTLFTVVGVGPRGFEFPKGAGFWVPVHSIFPEEAQKSRSSYVLWDAVGRLAPGASVQSATQDFQDILQQSAAQRPLGLQETRPVVTPLAELVTGDARPALWAATAAVLLLLLMACINIANLLLIRGSARTQELAIRTALGAGQSRLIRQLLTESGLLAVLGAIVAVPLAAAAVRVLVALAPAGLPRREMIEIDGRVLLVALGVAAVTALISGLLPAILSAAGAPGVWLRGGGRSASTNRRVQTLRHGLVIGQVALAVLVVAGAGLLVRSLVALQSADMGFEADRLLVFETAFPTDAFIERTQQMAAREEMLTRVGGIPEVVRAASLYSRPFSGQAGVTAAYSGDGQAAESQATNSLVTLEAVDSEYFRTLGIPIRRGRAFEVQDRDGAPAVAIVSEAVARHTWPGEDAIGKRLKLGPTESEAEWSRVIGIVGDTRYRELVQPQPTIYFPVEQFGGPVPMSLAVRTRGDPNAAIPQIREALRDVHPEWMLAAGGSMPQLLDAPLARPRFATLLLSGFAALTLLLAAVGIYGVMAATVSQRTREIGIRLALGATVHDVRNAVARLGLRLTLWGCAIGTVAALAGTRALGSLLFEISPTDPVTFVVVPVVLIIVALVACSLPARRATRVDPVVALRVE